MFISTHPQKVASLYIAYMVATTKEQFNV